MGYGGGWGWGWTGGSRGEEGRGGEEKERREIWEEGKRAGAPQREVEKGRKVEEKRSIQKRVFLRSNPSRERRRWEKELALRGSGGLSITGPLAQAAARALCPVFHSFFWALSPSALPFVPSFPPSPSFFRHEPCVIKQLGGAAEREREVMA